MHAEPVAASVAAVGARPALPLPGLTPGILLRFLAAGAFLGHGALVAREAVTWIADEPAADRLRGGLEAAAPVLLVAAVLLSWHLIPQRWPVPIVAALLAGWPAYAGFTHFVGGTAIPDGMPLRAVAMGLLCLAALILVSRGGQPSLNWAAMMLGLAGLVFALVSAYQWRDSCGLESLYGGCAVPGRLEEERLLAAIALPPDARWVEAGRVGATTDGAPGGLVAVPSRDARPGAFTVPSAYPFVGVAEDLAGAESERGRTVLGLWSGPSRRDSAISCAALLSRVDDPAKSREPITLRAKTFIEAPNAVLLRLVTWCERSGELL